MERLIALERELEALKVKNRRSQRLAVAAFGLTCVVFMRGRHEASIAASTPAVVEAERFVVKDASGTRAMLGTFDGQPGLGLMESGGVPAMVTLTNRGPAIEMRHGNMSVTLFAFGDLAGLALDGPQGTRASLGLEADGRSTLALNRQAKTPAAILNNDGLSLHDAALKGAAIVAGPGSETSGFGIFDAKQQLRVGFGVKGGKTFASLSDAAGNPLK